MQYALLSPSRTLLAESLKNMQICTKYMSLEKHRKYLKEMQALDNQESGCLKDKLIFSSDLICMNH